MIKAMRLRNLRSFSDSLDQPFIELKPITILVGKNSCGKSSFIRSLPLLRQSIEAKTTGPILWFGSYVDFGAFSEALNTDAGNNTIFFDFKLSINPQNKINEFFFWNEEYLTSHKNDVHLDVTVEVGVDQIKNKTVAKEIVVRVPEFTYKIIREDDSERCSLYINDELQLQDLYLISRNRSFIPAVVGIKKIIRNTADGKKVSGSFILERHIKDFYSSKLESILKPYFHTNTSEETITKGINNLGVMKKEDTYSILKSTFNRNSSFTKAIVKSKESICNITYELSMHKSLSNILDEINDTIGRYFSNIRYIAPLRATAERYYRHQDLQIDEIDHTGSNLAMLLKSLTQREQDLFMQWTSSNFGFKVWVEELGLHYALKIKTENDTKEYNINDMGFGFSQILPIVASIWHEKIKDNVRTRDIEKQRIFVIEQPELHLHPEYQSRLARMFCKVVSTAAKSGIKIIFETHSKTMIDTIGDCIEEKTISNEDVNIVLFDKKDDCFTNVSFSEFDKDGYLLKWPIGFFTGR
ncbi:AAA family ATPase [Shewanella sp. SM74]|uniref:AAA family ATPase n=1 Tax=Shewanella sp. SM74 TaxID=2912807 RepID=UPI0021D93846|nr:AAA family ATPase [Shewanella sp. SM74]MCU8012299.1 AAA family ATPase [Shewanella sp. SM74]